MTVDSVTASLPSTIPDAFRAAASRYSGDCALEAGETALTYAELDRLSNRVAHGLLQRGGREPVAMVAPLEPASIIVMLGALKAGRVFVPLDPRDPPERVGLVQEQLGALLVTADPLDELFGTRDDDPSLSLDPYGPSIVYFTSGSTGRPKGTIKSHNQLILPVTAYGIRHEDRFAITLPLAFAASAAPVFGTLLSGATGCLFDPVTGAIGALAEWIADTSVTVLMTSPTTLRATAEALEERGRSARSVRLAIVCGERCDGVHLETPRRALPDAVVVNAYGASEAGHIAETTIQPGEPLDDGPIPFRRVFPWQSVEIIDASGRPVPVGEAGEIVVSGSDISLGYWEEPEPGEQRFFESEGVRSVRTGDRGRLLPDGTLEHLGRADLRVKVHAQMVDPQTVEHALLALPTIREAVVSPIPGHDGDTRLVAHVLAEEGQTASGRELRTALAKRLPPFMIPSAFFIVDVIPRRSTGKIDRQALREAALGAAPLGTEYSPPRTPREHVLAEIVREVLGVERVGREDDIFELGADSLSTTELLVAIQERFGVTLMPADLLEASAVEALALRVDAGDPGERTICPLHLAGSGTPFFCVSGGGYNTIQLLALARRLDRPTYSFTPRGFERRARVDRSVERAAARYVRALRTIQPSGPYLIGGFSFGALIAYEMAQQLQSAREQVALLALLDPSWVPATYGDRARRFATGPPGSPRGPVAVARRFARQAAESTRVRIRVGTAGIVTRPLESQQMVFFELAARMGRRYRPKPYAGSSFLLRTRERDGDYADLAQVLIGERRVDEIPGDHQTVVREPHVAVTAALLREALQAADGRIDSPA